MVRNLGLICFLLLILVLINSNDKGLIFNGSCGAIIIICTYMILLKSKTNLFEPISLMSILYMLSFGIGPLILVKYGNYNIIYFGSNSDSLLSYVSIMTLTFLVLVYLAYFSSGLFLNYIPIKKYTLNTNILKCGGLLLFLIGITCFIVLVLLSGGINHFLYYSRGRADIFGTVFGGWFWGTFFMLSGLSALVVSFIKEKPFITFLISLLVGILYVLFQGRDQAISPIVFFIIIYYYRKNKIKYNKIVLIFAVMILFASLMGVYRQYDKNKIYKDPYVIFKDFSLKSVDHIINTLSQDIEQLDSFMVAVKIRETSSHSLNGTTMLAWAGPIYRHILHEDKIPIDAGVYMNGFINPEQKWSKTGMLPSLPGELYLNYGIVGIILGSCIYGIVLQLLNKYLLSNNEYLFSIYPYSLWIFSKMVIDGTHLLFKYFVVSTPLILLYMLAKILYFNNARNI